MSSLFHLGFLEKVDYFSIFDSKFLDRPQYFFDIADNNSTSLFENFAFAVWPKDKTAETYN